MSWSSASVEVLMKVTITLIVVSPTQKSNVVAGFIISSVEPPPPGEYDLHHLLSTNVMPPPPTSEYAITEGLECGRDKDMRRFARIIGGTKAQSHRWEWQAALYHHGDFICGATLIGSNLVLTSAHCVEHKDDTRDLFVRLGDQDRNIKELGEQDIQVQEVTIHKDWDSETFRNDIALLRLVENVVRNEDIGSVCLPNVEDRLKVQSTCYITGWGKTDVWGWESDILQEALLPPISNEECGRKNRKFNKSMIWSKMLCGGYEENSVMDASACMWDSGGPYVCKSNDRWYLHGIVSWGSKMCDGNHRYTVFTRVTEYVDWINDHAEQQF